MLTISKNRFLGRLDLLPESIRNFAFSLEIGGTLRSIAEAHHLNKERVDKILALSGAVLFGFVHRTDFAKEIGESVDLDAKIAQSIADEVGRKVFSRIQNELDEFYQPILTDEETPENRKNTALTPDSSNFKIPSFTEFHRTPSKTTLVPPPPPSAPTSVTTPAVTTPFVLHEERGMAENAKKDQMKGFSLPFGLFKPKQSEAPSTPRVTVEAPTDASAFAKASPDKKEEAKTVHYSEYRSNLPSHAGGEFINLETFGVKTRMSPNKEESTNITNGTSKSVAKTPVAQLPNYPVTSSPPTTPISSDGTNKADVSNISIKKPVIAPQTNTVAPLPTRTQSVPTKNENSPKVEGNTVDLR